MADDFDTENKCLAFCLSKIFVSELSANEEPRYYELQNSNTSVLCLIHFLILKRSLDLLW